MQHEEQIRMLAYQIWEQEGYPDGRDMEHWLQAEAMWKAKQVQKTPAISAVKPAPQKAIQREEYPRTQSRRSGK